MKINILIYKVISNHVFINHNMVSKQKIKMVTKTKSNLKYGNIWDLMAARVKHVNDRKKENYILTLLKTS